MNFNFKATKIEKVKFNYFINFLRAIAVLSVILYHSNFNVVNGGWLGVDIFFVISGYLIANRVLIEKDNFSLKSFFFKRYKRIVPALTYTVLLTIPFSIFLMTPNSLIEYSNALLPSIFFYSNFFFSSVESYTSELSKYNPLLHIWSLSIEEQFYIIFPILIIFFSKNLKTFLNLVIFIAAISFSLDIFEIGVFKFYFLQYRIWEFFLGVCLNFLNINHKNKTIFYISMVTLLFSLIYFDDSYIYFYYSKLIALLPVAILILVTKDEESLNLNFYRNKYLQNIGLASFSCYLLHQPIFAFFKLFQLKYDFFIFESYFNFLLILLTLFFGNLSFNFIEKKYMYNHSFLKSLILLTFIFFISIFSIFIKNWNTIDDGVNLPSKVIDYTDIDKYSLFAEQVLCHNLSVNELCRFNVDDANYDLYVLGDSTFRATSIFIADYRNVYKYNFTNITGSACVFLYNFIPDIWACPNIDKNQMDKFVGGINNSIIIYVARFPLYLEEEGFTNGNYKEDLEINIDFEFETEFINTVNRLLANKNLVVLVYPIPEQGWNVPNMYINNLKDWSQDVFYDYNLWKKRSASSYALLDKIDNQNVIRVYPEYLFCDTFIPNSCVGKYGDYLFYGDDDHLSIEGGELLAKYLLEEIFSNNEEIINNFSR